MTDHLAAIANNKLICTGVALSYEAPSGPDRRPATEEAFDALVTEYYKLFRESIRIDVAFLRSVEDSQLISSFDNAVYQLRTAKQHEDNPRAKAFYTAWIRRNRSWEAAAEAFLGDAEKALSALERVSVLVRRDAKLSKAWKANAAVEPDTIFEAVCRDLDVHFSYAHRKKLLYNVERHRQRLAPGIDVHAAVEQFCVQEITAAQDLTLPVPYFEILDRLGLLGKRNARAALLVAYSVRAATELVGDAFLNRVEETWRVGSG